MQIEMIILLHFDFGILFPFHYPGVFFKWMEQDSFKFFLNSDDHGKVFDKNLTLI